MAGRTGAAAAALALIMLAGCGGSSHGTSSGASQSEAEHPPSAALAGVGGRVLAARELEGFAPQGQRVFGTNAASWVEGLGLPGTEGAKEIARLEHEGFRAGVRERLAPTNGDSAEAISIVEQFNSPQHASAELANQLQGLHVRGADAFAVPGIPGALGVALATTQRSGINVEFADGSYYYIVGAGWPQATSSPPTRQQVEAAAQRLYRRTRG